MVVLSADLSVLGAPLAEADTARLHLSSQSLVNKLARQAASYQPAPDRRAGKKIILPTETSRWQKYSRENRPSVLFYKEIVFGAPADDGLITIFECELGRSPEELKKLMTELGEVCRRPRVIY